MPDRPSVYLRPGFQRGLSRGLPWVWERQLAWTPASQALSPGTVVDVLDSFGEGVATASIWPGAPLALRCWAFEPGVLVNATLLARRLERALALRARLYEVPFYRLAHADGDKLPGIVCDRYGDRLAVQLSADPEGTIQAPLLEAMGRVLAPTTVVLKQGDGREVRGEPPPDAVEVPEHDARFLADLLQGQKTGWYYDQRPHRRFARRICRGARVLDTFCHSGGFAIHAALGGAKRVLALDRSQAALSLAERAASLNGVASTVSWNRCDVFQAVADMAAGGRQFDLLICDPPPLSRQRTHRAAALQAHRRLAESAGRLLVSGGILLHASCSHAVRGKRFLEAVTQGLEAAGRRARLVHRGGAGPDHPVHPALPQTAYLDVLGLCLD